MEVRPGRGPERQGVNREESIYRLGLTGAMLAVLVESLGASMKWS